MVNLEVPPELEALQLLCENQRENLRPIINRLMKKGHSGETLKHAIMDDPDGKEIVRVVKKQRRQLLIKYHPDKQQQTLTNEQTVKLKKFYDAITGELEKWENFLLTGREEECSLADIMARIKLNLVAAKNEQAENIILLTQAEEEHIKLKEQFQTNNQKIETNFQEKESGLDEFLDKHSSTLIHLLQENNMDVPQELLKPTLIIEGDGNQTKKGYRK